MGELFGGLAQLGGAAINYFGQQNAMNQQMAMYNQNFDAQGIQLGIQQGDWLNQFNMAQNLAQQAAQQQQFANQVTYGGNISNVMSNVVNAAKANGLSPLAVLGMNYPGASVVPGGSIPSGGPSGGGVSAPELRAPDASGFGAAGQDIGRAVEGFYDDKARKAALAEDYMRAQITNLDAQSASLTMESARRLGAPGTPKPNKNMNEAIFGKEPQWPTGIPGDLATGLLKGIDWGAGKLDQLGSWFEHMRMNEPDPSIYNTP